MSAEEDPDVAVELEQPWADASDAASLHMDVLGDLACLCGVRT